MTADLRRARALTRDEHGLRAAVAHHEQRRFDLQAAQAVRDRTEDLLETISLIAADSALWDRLIDSAVSLDQPDIVALAWFDEPQFGAMLYLCGYTDPPPPPVEELLAGTREALTRALTARTGQSSSLVKDARKQLLTFTYRTRYQLSEPALQSPSDFAGRARRVARSAVGVLPVVIGAAVGSITNSLVPGLGFLTGPAAGAAASATAESVTGLAATKAAAKAAEQAATLATASAIALLYPPPDPSAARVVQGKVSPDQLLLPSADQALLLHLTLAMNALTEYSPGDPSRLSIALRHLQRLDRLGYDHDAPQVLRGACELAIQVLAALQARTSDYSAGEWPRDRSLSSDQMLELARLALELGLAARGEDSQFGKATFVMAPFRNTFDLGFDDSEQRQLDELWSRWLAGSASLAGPEHLKVDTSLRTTPLQTHALGTLPDTHKGQVEDPPQRYLEHGHSDG